jgi:hypothetical protein
VVVQGIPSFVKESKISKLFHKYGPVQTFTFPARHDLVNTGNFEKLPIKVANGLLQPT